MEQSKMLTLSNRIYNLLLRAYPASFRREYGRDMAQLFRDDLRGTLRENGTTALIGLWLLTFIDLIKTAIAEHIWEVFHMPMQKLLQRWSAPAAAIGGILWVFIVFIDVEGILGILLPTPVFLLMFLLMVVGLVGLYQRLPAGLRLGSRLAFGVALIGFLIMAASIIPSIDALLWGTAWAVLALILTVTAGIAGMGLIAIYTRALGRLSFVPLVQAASFLGFFVAWSESRNPVQMTFLFIFGISWVLLGIALWGTGEDTPGPALPA